MNNEFEIFESTEKNSGKDSQEILETKPPQPTILVIDDDLNVREALKLIFEKKYAVILSDSCDSGVKKMNSDIFVVVLDIKMEGKNGFETFIEIRKLNIYVPIIFLTAYQDLKDPFEIMNDYRPFGYVIKGTDSKYLLHTIESAFKYYTQVNKNEFLVKALLSKNLILRELHLNLETTIDKCTEELLLTNRELQKEIIAREKAENELRALLKEKEK